MIVFGKFFAAPVAALIGASLCAHGAFAASQTPAVTGCQTLMALSAETCTARVACPADDLLPKEAETLYMQCRDGMDVPTSRVTALLERYETPRAYTCCVGAALHRTLNKGATE